MDDEYFTVGRGGKPVKELAPSSLPTKQQDPPPPACVRGSIAGNILFLGPRAREDHLHYAGMAVTNAGTDAVVDSGIFHHPVMVVARPAGLPDQADVCVITSLNGANIHDKMSEKAVAAHIPLVGVSHPYAAPDSRYAPLTFLNGSRLAKPSFVNTGRILRVHLDLLFPHRQAPTSLNALKLTDESLQRLLTLRKDVEKAQG